MASASDGLVVAEPLMDGVDGRAVAALAASLAGRPSHRRARVRRPRIRAARAERGHARRAPAAPTWSWWSSAGPDANLGLARLEMLDAASGWADARARALGREPLQTFLDESSARLTLLMTSSGQVVAQHGFTRSLDVMAAAALGAGIVASTDGARPAHGLTTVRGAGPSRAPGRAACSPGSTRRGADGSGWWSSGRDLGGAGAAVLRPDGAAAHRRGPAENPVAPVLAENFEHELNASLKALFGR